MDPSSSSQSAASLVFGDRAEKEDLKHDIIPVLVKLGVGNAVPLRALLSYQCSVNIMTKKVEAMLDPSTRTPRETQNFTGFFENIYPNRYMTATPPSWFDDPYEIHLEIVQAPEDSTVPDFSKVWAGKITAYPMPFQTLKNLILSRSARFTDSDDERGWDIVIGLADIKQIDPWNYIDGSHTMAAPRLQVSNVTSGWWGQSTIRYSDESGLARVGLTSADMRWNWYQIEMYERSRDRT